MIIVTVTITITASTICLSLCEESEKPVAWADWLVSCMCGRDGLGSAVASRLAYGSALYPFGRSERKNSRYFHGSGHFSRSDNGKPTRPVIVENLLPRPGPTRPDPTRYIIPIIQYAW